MRVLLTSGRTLISTCLVGLLLAVNSHAATLDDVRRKGRLDCGVSTGIPGFSSPDTRGRWSGLDVDVCRAVAAAVLGDASKVNFTPLTPGDRFGALSSGEVDLLSRNTTWTHARDTTLGMIFAGIAFYDGQGFMVSRGLNVGSALELDGAAVCIQEGTTSELNLSDYFREHGMRYQPVVFTTSDQMLKGFEAGRCNVLSSDLSQLYAQRTRFESSSNVVILPEVISKEPLGPAVRQDDMQWYNIVKWALFAMVNAEEYGVNQANVDQMRESKKPVIQRMLGVNGDTGRAMGLDADWAYQVVKQVGNYGEVFERNVGSGSSLGFERGLNELWSQGGLLYAPPLR